MSLTPEAGSGVSGADSYASLAYIDAYWLARTHDAISATWSAATDANKEGAAREASTYLDATYGALYRGVRKGRVQGLEWPRTGAKDAAGYDLPDVPEELKRATAELAGRALSARLAKDLKRGGAVKRQKIGSLEQEFFEGASPDTRYGSVEVMIGPLLKSGAWNWA